MQYVEDIHTFCIHVFNFIRPCVKKCFFDACGLITHIRRVCFISWPITNAVSPNVIGNIDLYLPTIKIKFYAVLTPSYNRLPSSISWYNIQCCIDQGRNVIKKAPYLALTSQSIVKIVAKGDRIITPSHCISCDTLCITPKTRAPRNKIVSLYQPFLVTKLGITRFNFLFWVFA